MGMKFIKQAIWAEQFIFVRTVKRSNVIYIYGEEMNLLFLCSQNKRRSLTAEKIFDGCNGYKVRSAGTEQNARIKVTPGLLGWADIIFVFISMMIMNIWTRN